MILSDHGPEPLGGAYCRECGKVFPCEPYRREARDFAGAEPIRAAAQWGPEGQHSPGMPAPRAGGVAS